MKVSIYNNYSTSFKATKIATAKNFARGKTIIDIYKLSIEDKNFLEKLGNKISIKDLCPTLSESIQARWQKLFNYCIQEAKETGSHTYIAISDNKPCRILSYLEKGNKNNFLSGVCAIPDVYGNKTPLTGLTLLFQMFKDCTIKNAEKGIILEAIHNGPVDVLKKYEELGFTKNTELKDYTVMSSNKFKIKEALHKLQKQIEYIEEKQQAIDLDLFLD
jgi:hypothetical protein